MILWLHCKGLKLSLAVTKSEVPQLGDTEIDRWIATQLGSIVPKIPKKGTVSAKGFNLWSLVRSLSESETEIVILGVSDVYKLSVKLVEVWYQEFNQHTGASERWFCTYRAQPAHPATHIWEDVLSAHRQKDRRNIIKLWASLRSNILWGLVLFHSCPRQLR